MEGIFIFIPVLVIIIWVLVYQFDKNRIRLYLEHRGDAVISINWRLFGKGWLSESNKEGGGNRIYKVKFKDLYGNTKQAWCKTAMFSGVFLTNEIITEQAQTNGRPLTSDERIALLEEEVRRLREQNNG